MRNVKIEIFTTSPSDYSFLIEQLSTRYVAHEAVLTRPVRFKITIISAHNETERIVDDLLETKGMQSIKTPFTVLEKPKHTSPVAFLKRAA